MINETAESGSGRRRDDWVSGRGTSKTDGGAEEEKSKREKYGRQANENKKPINKNAIIQLCV